MPFAAWFVCIFSGITQVRNGRPVGAMAPGGGETELVARLVRGVHFRQVVMRRRFAPGSCTCGAWHVPDEIAFMSGAVRHILLILVVGGMVLGTDLGGPRLWDRDEPRNAGCTAEMLARGDWVTPVFDGELRTHKPILLYWFMMTAYALFGVNEWGARFWSAVCAVGTALVTYGIGRRLFSPTVAVWSALILLTTLMFDVAGRAATPDSLLIFWATAAVGVFVWGAFPKGPGERSGARGPGSDVTLPGYTGFLAMYGCMGVAVLAKGPVGVVLPTAVIGLYLLIERLPRTGEQEVGRGSFGQWARRAMRVLSPVHFLRTCWTLRPLTALAVVALIAVPWYVAVGLRTDGQWLHGFLFEHNLGRAARPMEGHGGPMGYYVVALLVGFFPWSVFAVPAGLHTARSLGERESTRAGHLLALCWMGVYMGLFSLAGTKLPSYITPCYPAVALLMGSFIEAWARQASRVAPYWPKIALLVLAGVGAAMVVVVPWAAARYLPGEQWLAALGLIPVVVGLGGWALLRVDRPRAAAYGFLIGAVAFTTALFTIGARRVDRHQTFDVLVQAIERYAPQPRVGTIGVLEPSWVFYLGQPLDHLAVGGTDVDSDPASEGGTRRLSASVTRSEIVVSKPVWDAWQFLSAGPERLAITTASQLAQFGPLPEGIVELARTPYFLERDELILLGTAAANTQRSDPSEVVAGSLGADARR